MNRLGKVLLGVLCMILPYAFSHASEIHWEKVKRGGVVKIAWDETTKLLNGRDISPNYPEAEGYVLGYLLYVTKNKEEIIDYPKPEPILKPKATIIFATSPGQFYIGVQTAIYKDKNLKSEPVTVSTISWSDSETSTNKNPFGVKVEN